MMTSQLAETDVVDDFWGELNRDILDCLAMGPVSPGEIGRRLGISEGAAASCLSLLAAEGRVRICLVEKGPASAGPLSAAS
jgi:predicted transcriptional regulator